MSRACQIDELKKLQSLMEMDKGAPQPQVGRSPEVYFNNLRKIVGAQEFEREFGKGLEILEARELSPDRPFSRDEVRACCQMREFPGMLAFALVMAWGGQRMDHFRLAGSNADLPRLIDDLRSSGGTRAGDYEKAMKAGIPGLGVSFMTKLLFFLRPGTDAYILDQWVARSLRLVCIPCPVRLAPWGGPVPDTTADEYDEACQAIEEIGMLVGGRANPLSGEATEIMLFSSPSGEWRQHVRETDSGSDGKHTTIQNKDAVDRSGCPFCKLAEEVRDSHKRERGNMPLPMMSPPTIHHKCDKKTPCRVYCGKDRGIEFYYHINKRSIRVGAFIPSNETDRHQRLWERSSVEKAGLGNRIEISVEGRTRALSIRLMGGIHTEGAVRKKLVGEAVAAMSELFQRIQEVLALTPENSHEEGS